MTGAEGAGTERRGRCKRLCAELIFAKLGMVKVGLGSLAA